MKIYLQPVYSRLIDSLETIPPQLRAILPDGLRLSRHQLETYQALTSGKFDVIFNSAITGDGKSLGGQLPVLVFGMHAPMLAMYPTNELIGDQESGLASTQQRWRTELVVGTLNGPKLDRIMDEGDFNVRGDALLSEARNHDVLLTNPDIFHLVMHQFYTRKDDAPDKIFGPLVNKFSQFTFDEFHIFEAPQIVSVINALLLIRELSSAVRPHTFLFLSATPGDLMLEYLNRSGLRVKEIRGQYCYEPAPDPQQWRQILQPAELHFDTLSMEEWLDGHLHDTLLPFFLDHRPGAKGAIIVNSVASAHRLLPRLRAALEPHGLRVETNTGFTARSRRKASYDADLLIGTSTVDVGVDFQINFLVFESRDAGSLMQRLGRLGRHRAFTRDGQTIPFDTFAAYALVPPWIQEALFIARDGAPALLQAEEAVDRERLHAAIRTAYPPSVSFQNYARTWGKFQTMRVMRGLNRGTIREEYSLLRQELHRRYQATFGLRLGPQEMEEYKNLYEHQRKLYEEVVAFRGSSPFTCCVIDEQEQGAERCKIADLLQLAPNARLEFIEEEYFYREAASHGVPRKLFERQEPLGFFCHRGWLDQRQDCTFFLDQDVTEWDANRFGKAVLLTGLRLDTAVPGWAQVNSRLCRRQIPALVCLGLPPLEVKRRLRLPVLFGLHPFESRDHLTGSIAFGRQALLLETRLEETKRNVGGTAYFL